MEGPAADPREESIGDLFGRLIEDGRTYAEAELALIRAIAEYRAQRAGRALGAFGAGIFLALSATSALVVGAVIGFSQYMSPFLAGLLVAAVLGAAGYVLIKVGQRGIKGLGRDEAEQQAIDQGMKP